MESRDWLNCSTPQAVRAAVKRVVEYIEKADHQIRLFVRSEASVLVIMSLSGRGLYKEGADAGFREKHVFKTRSRWLLRHEFA